MIKTREEAIKVIEDFSKAGGNMFIDGCKGEMSDRDLIQIAESCLELLEKNEKDTTKEDGV